MKTVIRIQFVILITFLVLNTGCQVHYNTLPGFNYTNFKGAPCWEIANAVNDNDSLRIMHLVKSQKMDLNCFDTKFGASLLDLATINNKAKAFEALLQAGVDVNARSPEDSSTTLYQLCSYSTSIPVSFYMVGLVTHGADVNASIPDSLEGKAIRTTCFEQLVENCRDIEPIKYMLDHKVNLDIYPKYGRRSIIGLASINRDLRPLRYLLIERGLEIPRYISIRDEGSAHQEVLTLRKVLDERDLASYPDQQKVKEEILVFLASQGQ